MSISTKIMEYLSSLPASELSHASASTIAPNVGTSAGKASKLLWSLENTGRLRLRRQGRAIVGIDEVIRVAAQPGKPLEPVAAAKRSANKAVYNQAGAPVMPRHLRTPLLDRYAEAKARAAQISQSGESEFFEVTFRENPMAEEGIRLRDAYVRLEEQYKELSSQYKLTLYEYAGVKDRLRNRHAADVLKQQQEAYADAD